MAELIIQVNHQPKVIESLLVNELAPLIEQLEDDKLVSIMFDEAKMDLKFKGVQEQSRAVIVSKAEEVISAYVLNP
jgi:hypothetical protein